MVLICSLTTLLILNISFRICDSSSIKTNHKLGLSLSRESLDQLCKKLSDSKTPNTCNIVSCIGANSWKQRHFVETNFGLDPSKSSTLSGPLKPRNDLWELGVNNGFNLLLDSEIPNFENEVKSAVENSSLIKLSALSKCIYIFLNEEDFDINDEEISLNTNVQKFFENLSKIIELEVSGSEKKIKNIFVILPDFKSFERKCKVSKSHLSSIERALNYYFPKNLYVKKYNDTINVSKSFKSISTLNVQEVVDVLKSFTSPNQKVGSLLDYLRNKSFQNLNKFVDDSLERALNNERMDEFANTYRAQLTDSKISYYTIVMELLGRNYPIDLFKVSNLHNANLCLQSLAKNLEREIMLEFVKYYVTNSNSLNINVVVDQFIHKYNMRMKSVIPLIHMNEISELVKGTSARLRRQMYYIDDIYKRFPNKEDAGGPTVKSLKEKMKKMKKRPELTTIFHLVGVLKDKGDGNARGFFNYRFNSIPLLLTLGYSNDRDVSDDGSGTGIMGPRIKIQPKVIFKVDV